MWQSKQNIEINLFPEEKNEQFLCELRKVADKLTVKYSKLSIGYKMVGSFSIKNNIQKYFSPKASR